MFNKKVKITKEDIKAAIFDTLRERKIRTLRYYQPAPSSWIERTWQVGVNGIKSITRITGQTYRIVEKDWPTFELYLGGNPSVTVIYFPEENNNAT